MKLNFLRALPLAAASLALASCSSANPDSLNGEWEVVALQGKSLDSANEKPFLGFDTAKGTIYGYTGCNRLTGSCDPAKFLKGNETFDRLGMTRMFCQDSPEEEFLKALNETKRVELSKNTLILQNGKKQEVMKLRKR